MKLLRLVERVLQMVLFTLIGVFCVTSVTFAFQNLSTTGGSSTGGGGTVGSLQQVTAVGNTTTLPIYVTGAGFVSSTKFLADSGSVSAPTFAFGAHPQTGLYDVGGLLSIASNGTIHASFGGTAFRTVFAYPLAGDTYDVGDVTLKWRNGWYDFLNASTTAGSSADALSVSGTAKVTQQVFSGSGSVSTPGYTFSAHTNTGLFDFSGQLRVAVGGINSFVFEGSAADTLSLFPLTTGVSDIGSASLVYRTEYIGNLNASGTAGNSTPTITATGTVLITGAAGTTLQICNNGCTALASGQLSISQATGLFTIGGAGGSTDLNLSARGAGVIVMTNTDFSPNSGKGSGAVSLGTASLFYNNTYSETFFASSTGAIQPSIYSTGTVFLAGTGAPAVTSDFVCLTAGSSQITHATANCTVSSAYFKDHIKSLSPSDAMAEVRKLRSVTYRMKSTGNDEEGFIAEEVARIDPTLVAYTDGSSYDDSVWLPRLAFIKANYPDVIRIEDGKTLIPQTVDYARFTVILNASVQNIDDRLTKLEHK